MDLFRKKGYKYLIFVIIIIIFSICGFLWYFFAYKIGIWNYPKPAQYAISKQAKCTSITDYAYDDGGRLAVATQYCYVGGIYTTDDTGKKIVYSYDNTFLWYQKKHTLYFYDNRDRLIKTEQYVSNIPNILHISSDEPYSIVEYRYDEEGGYSETGSTLGEFDYEKTYDSSGNLLWDVTDSKSRSLYYFYSEDGNLAEVKDGDNLPVAKRIYDDTGAVSVLSYRSGSYYAIWLDYYNSTNRTASYWYLARSRDFTEEYSFEEIESVSLPSYQTHYDGERLIDAITANEWIRTLKPNENDEVRKYEFFDYDEAGQVIWHYWMTTSATSLNGTHYIYDGKQLVHEVSYTIAGDWKHTLYDGSEIAIRRNDNKLVDITRFDSAGNVLYCYQFENDYLGQPSLLTYTLNASGDVVTDWCYTKKTLAALDAQKNNEQKKDDNDKDTEDTIEKDDKTPPVDWSIYYVRKGDSLWSIAEELLYDGNRWIEIYELNRDVIGGNPRLIYEGMELKIR